MKPIEPGTPLPASHPSDDTLALLGARRSTPAKTMTGPGPSSEQIDTMLALAARVPDHRMMVPFRFVIIDGETLPAFADVLRGSKAAPDGKAEKAADLYAKSACVIAVVSSVDRNHKTPVWEQELTAGAVCQNLLLAASAQGFAAQWLTGWPAYDDTVGAALQVGPNERIAGFFFLGTATTPPEERKRPDLDAIVTRWTPV